MTKSVGTFVNSDTTSSDKNEEFSGIVTLEIVLVNWILSMTSSLL